MAIGIVQAHGLALDQGTLKPGRLIKCEQIEHTFMGIGMQS